MHAYQENQGNVFTIHFIINDILSVIYRGVLVTQSTSWVWNMNSKASDIRLTPKKHILKQWNINMR